MFLVDSRVAVIDIVYLTLAAWSYLLLFRFAESSDPRDRRRTLAAMGVTLGFCLGSKLLIPAVTFLLCAPFMAYSILRADRAALPAARMRQPSGARLLIRHLSAACSMAPSLPTFT